MNLSINLPDFRSNLLDWFDKNARKLPWRDNPHWYKTFLSEFMLQQTQVEQVIPYFHKFYTEYPDIYGLADADEHDVLTLWAGLGYYSRARNLRKAAKKIVDEFSGEFPQNVKDALSLNGIGIYTAHAILSIAFNKPFAVVDGNVKRVLSRLLTLDDDITSAQSIKKISAVSESLLDKNQPSKYNEALMELGATVCFKRNPRCTACPVRLYCKAFAKNEVHKYPVKSAPKKKRDVFYFALVIVHGGKILITKRAPSGLLASMWEFPSLEAQKEDINKDELLQLIRKKFGVSGKIRKIYQPLKHQYTHLNALYTPITFSPEKPVIEKNGFDDFKWIKPEELASYPIHGAHKKIIGKLEI